MLKDGEGLPKGVRVRFLEPTSRIERADGDDGFTKQYLTLRMVAEGCGDWAQEQFDYVAYVQSIGIRVIDISHNIEDWDNSWDDGEWRETNCGVATARFYRSADIPVDGIGEYEVKGAGYMYSDEPSGYLSYVPYDDLKAIDAAGLRPGRLEEGKVFSCDAHIAHCQLYIGQGRRVLLAFVPVAYIAIAPKADSEGMREDIQITGAPSICLIGNWENTYWDECDQNRTLVAEFLKQGKLIRVENAQEDYPDWVVAMSPTGTPRAHACREHLDARCRCLVCGKTCHAIVDDSTGSGTGMVTATCTRCGAFERYYDDTGIVIESTL